MTAGSSSSRDFVAGVVLIESPLAIYLLLYRVGKTSLMNQYVNKRFSNQYKATIGADLCVVH